MTADIAAVVFTDIKRAYADAREEQRQKIVDYFKQKGYEPVTDRDAGHGKRKYKDGKAHGPIDMWNWMWVEVIKDECMIGLQCFDQDPNSKNVHVAFDRLSICHPRWTLTDEFRQAPNPNHVLEDPSRYLDTDIDLPMTDEKLQELECHVQEFLSPDNKDSQQEPLFE